MEPIKDFEVLTDALKRILSFREYNAFEQAYNAIINKLTEQEEEIKKIKDKIKEPNE